MFERYTEQARRALFFARYECSQLGSPSIETKHLLLGLIRESRGLTAHIITRSVSLETLRREIEERAPAVVEKIPTSVEIPFSAEVQRVLNHAADEADRLKHSYTGTEHLLLGLLREESSVAASILISHGARLHDARQALAELSRPPAPPSSSTGTELLRQIDDIKETVARLARLPPDSNEARALVAGINARLDALRQYLMP